MLWATWVLPTSRPARRRSRPDGTVRTAGHAAQIGVYELLAGAAIGQPITAPAEIIGLQVAKTDKGRRAAVGVITGARELLVGTEEQPGLLQMAARMIRSGDFTAIPNPDLYRKILPGVTWMPVEEMT